MPRLKKPMIFDTHIDRSTGLEYPIWLDRENGQFFVVVNDEKIYDPVAAEVRKKLLTALEKNTPLLWVPVIELTSNTWIGDRSSGEAWGKLALTADRYYVTLRSAGVVRQSPWNISPSLQYNGHKEGLSIDEIRLGHSKAVSFPKNEDGSLQLPCRFMKAAYGLDHTTVLPYTEETWENVIRMTYALKQLAAKVEKLYAQADNTNLLRKALSTNTLALSSGNSDEGESNGGA